MAGSRSVKKKKLPKRGTPAFTRALEKSFSGRTEAQQIAIEKERAAAKKKKKKNKKG